VKLGIGTYAYMWAIGVPGGQAPASPLTAQGLLEKAIELDVHVVQYGPNLPSDSLSNAEFERLVATAEEHAVELELGTAGFDITHLRKQIALAKRARSRTLRTIPDYTGEAPLGKMEDSLREVAGALQDADLRLGIENARIPAMQLSALLDAVAHPCIGVTLDTVNSLAIPEGTAEVATALARHTVCLHVKDFAISRIWHSMGFTVEGRPAGQGQLDIPWLLELLRRSGVSPNAILELWVPQQATLEQTIELEEQWAMESVRWLRDLIPE
jgi:3-oxoisoapionate decarboxylase